MCQIKIIVTITYICLRSVQEHYIIKEYFKIYNNEIDGHMTQFVSCLMLLVLIYLVCNCSWLAVCIVVILCICCTVCAVLHFLFYFRCQTAG